MADRLLPQAVHRHQIHLNPSQDEQNCFPESQTSEQMTQNELLTQNELTQLGEIDEDTNSPLSICPVNPRSLAWGRLIPSAKNDNRIDLYPKDPSKRHDDADGGISFLGLSNLDHSDCFNEYTLGRSSKCDITATKAQVGDGDTEKEVALLQWVHGMVSNLHCKIFCMLNTSSGNMDMDVYVEDTSNNGTLVNGTTLLKRGERRILHTGDEICLVNPDVMRKKTRSTETLSDLQRQYSFLFVNVYQQQGHAIQKRLMPSSAAMPPPAAKRRGLVDVRATKNHSQSRYPPSEAKTPQRARQRRRSPRRQQPRRFEEDYDIRDLLGSGTCGEVRRAIHRRTGEERAVKIIAHNKRSRSSLLLEHTSSFEAEVSILQDLDHPYIVKLIDVFVSPGKAVYLVMELLHGGDLFDRIVQKGRYTETESRRVMRRLLNALHYLHEERDIVHRDLKPENILCVNKNSDINVKLTDFGLAKSVTDEGLKTFCGTPQYFAPEVLRRRHTVAGRGRYGKKSDMWSLGVILYILLSGIPPYEEAREGWSLQFPPDHFYEVSEEAKQLVASLLQIDPSKRISVEEACQHKWILHEDGDTHRHPLDDPATKPSIETSPHTSRTKNPAPILKNEQPETNESLTVSLNDGARTIATNQSPNNRNQKEEPDMPTRVSEKLEDKLVRSSNTTEGEATSSNVKSEEVTPSPANRNALLPCILNQHIEHFRSAVVKSAAESSPDDKENQVQTAKPMAEDEDTVELLDDKICSQFSDEEIETISSFGSSFDQSTKTGVERVSSTSSSSVEARAPTPEKPLPKKKRRKTKPVWSIGENVWKHDAGATQPAKKPKSTKNKSTKTQRMGNNGTQTTLASFFQARGTTKK